MAGLSATDARVLVRVVGVKSYKRPPMSGLPGMHWAVARSSGRAPCGTKGQSGRTPEEMIVIDSIERLLAPG